jgi:hypothetical protein
VKKHSEAPRNPDIDFVADVKARELCFDEVPDTEVRFRGYPEHNSVSGTKRENLPEEVRSGVIYRNISVKLRIAAELADGGQDQ